MVRGQYSSPTMWTGLGLFRLGVKHLPESSHWSYIISFLKRNKLKVLP